LLNKLWFWYKKGILKNSIFVLISALAAAYYKRSISVLVAMEIMVGTGAITNCLGKWVLLHEEQL
jgi:hypothetical protein